MEPIEIRPASHDRYAHLFLNCPGFTAEYSVLSKIGKGSSSNVYLARSRQDGGQYAVKANNHMKLKSKSNQTTSLSSRKDAFCCNWGGNCPRKWRVTSSSASG